MAVPLPLAVGDHYLVSDLVDDWRAEFADTKPPSVVLTASVQAGPNPPIFPNQGHMATTLAVQMDAQVAMLLHRKLDELGRKMGWLPQTKG